MPNSRVTARQTIAASRRTSATVAGVVAAVALILSLFWNREPGEGEPGVADSKTERSPENVQQRRERDSGRRMLDANKASVSGTILDPDGAPIAGATVCAESDNTMLFGAGDKLPKCTTSEHDGHYRLDGLWPVSTTIHAGAPQFIPVQWSERVGHGERNEIRLHSGEERREIDITLERGGMPIRGVVKDIGGGVIDGAFVTSYSDAWHPARAIMVARTDAEGRFELWVKPGLASLTAMAEGYAGAGIEANAPTELATIFLTPESVIEGTVVHVETGMPVAGVTVSGHNNDPGRGGFGETITDAEGRFRLDGLTPGIYDLSATADELYGEGAEQLPLGLGQSAEDVVISVHPTFSVAGKVTIAETNAPCTEGWVRLERSGQHLSAQIGENGEVLVRAVMPDTFVVAVDCMGHVSEQTYEPIVIADQSRVDLEWKVHVGLAIRGVVVDAAGAPVVGLSVNAVPNQDPDAPRAQQTKSFGKTTDKQGQFELSGLLPGTYQLSTRGNGHPSLKEPVTVTLGESADVEGVRLVLPATGRLVGIVRDENGSPVSDVGITASALTGGAWAWYTSQTGDDGRFEFAQIEAGSIRVRADVRSSGSTDDDLQGEVVEIVAGSETEIELTVEQRTLTIRGRVLDSDGVPVSDAFVDATRTSDSASFGGRANLASARWGWDRKPVLSDQDGGFEIGELSEGEHVVRAYRKGGGEGVLEHVAAGSTGIDVTIVGTSQLSGKVVLAGGGGSPERFQVMIVDRSKGLARSDDFFRTEGKFTLRELVPGKYEVHASGAEGTVETEVVITAGQSIDDLTLELIGKVTVQGRLVDAETRAPVPDMDVRISGAGGSFSGNPNAAQLEHVSDAEGRFRVDGVSVGDVYVRIMPRGSMDTYGMSRVGLNLPSQPAVQDIGEIELLRMRTKPGEKSGDLGYKLAQVPPETKQEDRYLEVAFIRPGGPADGTGLAAGDRIVDVDGKAVSGRDGRYSTLTSAPVGTSIVLGIEGGKKVTIVLGPPVQ